MGQADEDARGYRELFFRWCVPGIILVVLGRLSDRLALAHFGMALLAIGVFHYGRIKRYRRWWAVVWLSLCGVYLAVGFLELIR